MSSTALIADIVFLLFMAFSLFLGIRAGHGENMNLAQWSVGGRNLGVIFIWVLMAGEVYTSFSYLGAAGWGYEYGVPIYYEFAYLACGYAIGYFIGPLFWNYAKKYNLVSTSDIVAHRFRSRFMGALIAVVATIFLLPYVQLQLAGMGVVVSTISYGSISLVVGYIIAFIVSVGFVVISGMRGSAWVSVLKDTLVIVTMLIMAIYIPYHYFGGYSGLFDRLISTHKGWLTLPGHSHGLGVYWFFTTGILNSIGYNVFPSTMGSVISARNADVVRKNSIFLPFYQILLFVPMLLGMAALFIVPGIKDSNLALFAMAIKVFPGWLMGVIGAAGALSSIVPMAVFMLVIGTMWAKNVFRCTTDAQEKRYGQVLTLLTGLIALVMAIFIPSTLVRLSVISYEGLSQFAPILILGLLWPKMNVKGALSGLAVGVVVDAAMVFSKHDPWHGINAGLIALVLNLIVTWAVSVATASDDKVREARELILNSEVTA